METWVKGLVEEWKEWELPLGLGLRVGSEERIPIATPIDHK